MDAYGMDEHGWKQGNKIWELYKVNLSEAVKAPIPIDKELENFIRKLQKLINSEAVRRGIDSLAMIGYFAINKEELEELLYRQDTV
jgi:hypothetical protein